jgi:hypothetical protein
MDAAGVGFIEFPVGQHLLQAACRRAQWRPQNPAPGLSRRQFLASATMAALLLMVSQ